VGDSIAELVLTNSHDRSAVSTQNRNVPF